MIWGAGTGVLKLTSYSGLPTDSIITSPDKFGVFHSFSDTTTFLASSVPSPSYETFHSTSSHSSPSSETFSLASSPTSHPSDIFSSASIPYSSPSEGYPMVFNRMPTIHTWFLWHHSYVIWDQTGTALSSLLFLFFCGDFFGAYRLAQLPCWGGIIYSAWHWDNDLVHPRMGKIMIYHVQSHSELFRNKFRTKLRNVIGFGTGASFTCAWRVQKSNPIHNKINPLNSFM